MEINILYHNWQEYIPTKGVLLDNFIIFEAYFRLHLKWKQELSIVKLTKKSNHTKCLTFATLKGQKFYKLDKGAFTLLTWQLEKILWLA